MKNIKVVMCLIVLFGCVGCNVFGASALPNTETKSISSISSGYEQEIENQVENQIGEFLKFDSLKDIDLSTLLLNPLKIFWIFGEAIVIVIAINVIAKVVCKIFLNYSETLRNRKKSRELDKVLRDLYE